jgi:ketosteroid isomerase-like protein
MSTATQPNLSLTAQNKQLVQQIFAGLAEGNAKLFVDCMADDFAWTVTGTTPWSRTYTGKSAVLGELFGALRTRVVPPLKTIAQRIVAEDDIVVVEARGSNTTTAGKPYNNRYCFVFRLAGGKLKEVTEYLDTELVTSALGSIQG